MKLKIFNSMSLILVSHHISIWTLKYYNCHLSDKTNSASAVTVGI